MSHNRKDETDWEDALLDFVYSWFTKRKGMIRAMRADILSREGTFRMKNLEGNEIF